MANKTKEIDGRISREELFLGTALLFSKRSTCLKKNVGAVFTKDNRIIATGYNGVLPHKDHSEGLDNLGITHTVHAEMNAIAFAAKNGIALKGFKAYLTLSPCEKCAEAMIQAGVSEVIFIEQYRNTDGLQLLSYYGIPIKQQLCKL
jgi:dCMP deaminase